MFKDENSVDCRARVDTGEHHRAQHAQRLGHHGAAVYLGTYPRTHQRILDLHRRSHPRDERGQPRPCRSPSQ